MSDDAGRDPVERGYPDGRAVGGDISSRGQNEIISGADCEKGALGRPAVPSQRASFKSVCDCHAAESKVVAQLVFNHDRG